MSLLIFSTVQKKSSNIGHTIDGEKHPDFLLLLLRLRPGLEDRASASVAKLADLHRL